MWYSVMADLSIVSRGAGWEPLDIPDESGDA
jgi:hypothetical protein